MIEKQSKPQRLVKVTLKSLGLGINEDDIEDQNDAEFFKEIIKGLPHSHKIQDQINNKPDTNKFMAGTGILGRGIEPSKEALLYTAARDRRRRLIEETAVMAQKKNPQDALIGLRRMFLLPKKVSSKAIKLIIEIACNLTVEAGTSDYYLPPLGSLQDIAASRGFLIEDLLVGFSKNSPGFFSLKRFGWFSDHEIPESEKDAISRSDFVISKDKITYWWTSDPDMAYRIARKLIKFTGINGKNTTPNDRKLQRGRFKELCYRAWFANENSKMPFYLCSRLRVDIKNAYRSLNFFIQMGTISGTLGGKNRQCCLPFGRTIPDATWINANLFLLDLSDGLRLRFDPLRSINNPTQLAVAKTSNKWLKRLENAISDPEAFLKSKNLDVKDAVYIEGANNDFMRSNLLSCAQMLKSAFETIDFTPKAENKTLDDTAEDMMADVLKILCQYHAVRSRIATAKDELERIRDDSKKVDRKFRAISESRFKFLLKAGDKRMNQILKRLINGNLEAEDRNKVYSHIWTVRMRVLKYTRQVGPDSEEIELLKIMDNQMKGISIKEEKIKYCLSCLIREGTKQPNFIKIANLIKTGIPGKHSEIFERSNHEAFNEAMELFDYQTLKMSSPTALSEKYVSALQTYGSISGQVAASHVADVELRLKRAELEIAKINKDQTTRVDFGGFHAPDTAGMMLEAVETKAQINEDSSMAEAVIANAKINKNLRNDLKEGKQVSDGTWISGAVHSFQNAVERKNRIMSDRESDTEFLRAFLAPTKHAAFYQEMLNKKTNTDPKFWQKLAPFCNFFHFYY